ncbi:MAG: hypothetical protein ACK4IX_00935 [Candidatus Sericytochromatia bacterium]
MEIEKKENSLELSEKVLDDETKKKIIEETYAIYSEESVNISIKETKNKNENKPEENKIKKITFEEEKLDNLVPEIQDIIKKLLDTSTTKNQVAMLIKELEQGKDKFLKKQDGLFGKLSDKELETLEKKLAETEVSQEVTEANLAAIVSCLNNIMSN